MAIREEELDPRTAEAVVYRFPTAAVRRRAAAQRRAAIRRRRSALAGIFLVFLVGSMLAGGQESIAPASSPSAPEAVVLAPGDTLWDVAERYAPEGTDPRAYVDLLLAANDISGAPSAGARIVLP